MSLWPSEGTRPPVFPKDALGIFVHAFVVHTSAASLVPPTDGNIGKYAPEFRDSAPGFWVWIRSSGRSGDRKPDPRSGRVRKSGSQDPIPQPGFLVRFPGQTLTGIPGSRPGFPGIGQYSL